MRLRTAVPLVALLAVAATAAAAPPQPHVSRVGRVASWVQNKFRGISQRHDNTRVLHRPGEAYQATLHAAPGSPLGGPSTPVTVRLSRGAGSAEPKKDFLGLAVRVPHAGGNEDLLLVSSGNGRLGRRIPSQSGSFFGKSYSSILPVKVDGQKYLVRAYPTAQAPGSGTDFDGLHRALSGGSASFRMVLQGLHGAPDRPLGDVTLQRPLGANESNGLKFRMWNNPTVKPTGMLNTLRRWAYQGSQSTR